MTDAYDSDDVIITPSELSFGGRLEPHQHEGDWFIKLSLPNSKERLTPVSSEHDAARLIDETLDLLTRVVVLCDAEGVVVLEGDVYDVGNWLDGEYHEGGNPASYQTTDEHVNCVDAVGLCGHYTLNVKCKIKKSSYVESRVRPIFIGFYGIHKQMYNDFNHVTDRERGYSVRKSC